MTLKCGTVLWILLATTALADQNCKADELQDVRSHISELSEIRLHSGVNSLRFPGIAHDIEIVSAWSNAGNLGAHTNICVLDRDSKQPSQWDVLSVGSADCVQDTPYDGEALIKTVRFFKARVDGRPAALLIITQRDLDSLGASTPYDPTQAKIAIYQAQKNTDESLEGTLSFGAIFELTTKTGYCNADAALEQELRVPLHPQFGAKFEGTGCAK